MRSSTPHHQRWTSQMFHHQDHSALINRGRENWKVLKNQHQSARDSESSNALHWLQGYHSVSKYEVFILPSTNLIHRPWIQPPLLQHTEGSNHGSYSQSHIYLVRKLLELLWLSLLQKQFTTNHQNTDTRSQESCITLLTVRPKQKS